MVLFFAKIKKKNSDIRVFFGNMSIYSLAHREFENPREFENFPRAAPSGNFQIPSDFQIPSGQREYIGIFPQKTRISYTNFDFRGHKYPPSELKMHLKVGLLRPKTMLKQL